MQSRSRMVRITSLSRLTSGTCSRARWSATRLHRAVSLAGKEVDLNAVTRVLTSLKGVTLSVRATDRLDGNIRVDFRESPSPLKQVAKALLFEVLEDQGMMLEEIKDWAILVEAKAITLKGRLSTSGLRTLTNLIPVPGETLNLPKTDAESRGDGAWHPPVRPRPRTCRR